MLPTIYHWARAASANTTIHYRDHVLMWAKDLKRSVDYLHTRADIDTTKLGYFGLSWGGQLGGIMIAVEPRIRAGKHDHYFPVESSQKPFFRLLGTPAAYKKYSLYEGGHFVPRTQLIAESLSWLDRYLGPVR